MSVLDEQVVQRELSCRSTAGQYDGSAGSTMIVPYSPISSPKSSRMCGWYQ